MPGFYTRSNGDLAPIDEMPFPHLKAATDGLRRKGDSDRTEELANMDARLAVMRAEYIASLEAELPTADPERAVFIRSELARLAAAEV